MFFHILSFDQHPDAKAEFSHAKLESSSNLRMAHKLNSTVMNSTSIQQASAKMTMALFDDSTVNAMKYFVEEY